MFFKMVWKWRLQQFYGRLKKVEKGRLAKTIERLISIQGWAQT